MIHDLQGYADEILLLARVGQISEDQAAEALQAVADHADYAREIAHRDALRVLFQVLDHSPQRFEERAHAFLIACETNGWLDLIGGEDGQ